MVEYHRKDIDQDHKSENERVAGSSDSNVITKDSSKEHFHYILLLSKRNNNKSIYYFNCMKYSITLMLETYRISKKFDIFL